jgi:fumagillin biosynthesis transferase
MSVTSREDVEFRTLDGLTLRGWLYPASKAGPALIMTQGVWITINDYLVS